MQSFAKLAQETFEQHNFLRTNPSSFIPDLESLLKLFKGQILYKPGEIPLRTNEGPNAINECIQFLKSAKPLPEFKWIDELSRASQDHADDIGPKSIVGHSGSDGSSMSDRIEKYGEWEFTVGENIDFGGKTGREVVCDLIVDDGNGSRGHRKNIFNPKFLVCGVGAQKHGQYKSCVVIDYAGGYIVKGLKPNVQQSQAGQYQFQQKGASPQTDFGQYQQFNQKVGPSSQDFGLQQKVASPQDFGYQQKLGAPQDFGYAGNLGNKNYPNEFSEIKSFFGDKFKDVPEMNRFNDQNNPTKYTYTYKTSGQQNPMTNIVQTNDYNDKFKNDFLAKNFNEDSMGKANLNDYGPAKKLANQQQPKQKSDDNDKPENTIQTRVTRNITITNGKKCIIEKKIYTLRDGTTKVVENQTMEN